MQYVNAEKTAAICNVCGNVIALQKTTLPNGDLKISMTCPVCGNPDVDIFKKDNNIMEAKMNPKPLPPVDKVSPTENFIPKPSAAKKGRPVKKK